MTWTSAGDHLSLTIRQVQTDAPVFAMPIEVLIESAGGAQRRTIWNDRKEQTFAIPWGDSVVLDPDDWILKHVTYGAAP